jgi:hypothetical protein
MAPFSSAATTPGLQGKACSNAWHGWPKIPSSLAGPSYTSGEAGHEWPPSNSRWKPNLGHNGESKATWSQTPSRVRGHRQGDFYPSSSEISVCKYVTGCRSARDMSWFCSSASLSHSFRVGDLLNGGAQTKGRHRSPRLLGGPG